MASRTAEGATIGRLKAPPFAPHLSARRTTWLCILGYVALTLLIYAPVSPWSTTRLPAAGIGNPAGSDAFQMSWFLTYLPYALTHGASLFHTNVINYPTGINLFDNTPVPLLSLIGWPITATLGPIATFNVLIRLAFVASSLSMFFVLRRWCSSWQACFVGGLFYGFSPYMISQSLHLDLLFVPIPPLLILMGDELLARRRLSAPLLGLAIGLAAGCQFLISPDILSGSGTMAILLIAGLALFHRDLIRPLTNRVMTAGAIAFGVFALIAGVPIYEMLTGPAHLTGPVLTISNLQGDSADLFGSITPSSNLLLVPRFLSYLGDHLVADNLSENGSYLGIPLLLVLRSLFRRLRSNATVMFFGAAALAALVLSLGGHLVIASLRTPIPLPGDVLQHLPLLQDTIPARYSLYVVLFLSVALAIGIDRLWLAPFTNPARFTEVGSSETSTPANAAATEPSRQKIAVVAAVVTLSLLPNVPFANGVLAIPPGLPTAIANAIPRGDVVALDPATALGHAGAMAWQAETNMAFRLVGAYANVNTPGQNYGAKGPVEPAFLGRMPAYPASAQHKVPVATYDVMLRRDQADLRAYLNSHAVNAFVFTGNNPPRDGVRAFGYNFSQHLAPQGYAFLTATLGRPNLIGPGYVIWLSGSARWDRRAGA